MDVGVEVIKDGAEVRGHEILVLLLHQFFSDLEGIASKDIINDLTLNEQLEEKSASKFITKFLTSLCETIQILII